MRRRVWAAAAISAVLGLALVTVLFLRTRAAPADPQGRIGSLLVCQQFAKKQLVASDAEFESPYRRSEADLRENVVEEEPGVYVVHDVVSVPDAAGRRIPQGYRCTVQHAVESEWRVLTLRLDP